ncbi:unnamed protein product [Blepharisma stoltei]|uniref:Protein translocase subunit SecA n=1 Tax=Blepharisma stoltei TaxID=1481888 RepID=A0AAU9IUX8_9CILI|nr:unnamed protein product [Blepharisma stoltei]
MFKILEDNVWHIKSIAVKHPLLKNITISSHDRSETRYITMVPIKIKNSEETVYLCDTPGLMDTNGTEVDIANTISIAEHVKNCRSVRPVILLSSQAQGDRFEGIKKIAYTLMRLIPDFNKYRSSFTYVFTKYSEDEASNIHGKVINALANTKNSDIGYRHILEDIEQKTVHEVITINHLDGNPQKLIQKIMEREPIYDPKNVFKSFITEDSRISVMNQLSIHSKDIEKALNSINYEIIKQKLDEVKYIANLFSMFENQYNQCVESVIRTTNNIYQKVVSQFNSFLESHAILDENIIQTYQEVHNYLKKIEEIRECHLREETVNPAAMITNIVFKLGLINFDLRDEDIDSYILKAQISNAKILRGKFQDIIPYYANLCKEYETLIRNLLGNASSNLEINNFKGFVENLLQEQKFLDIARDHLCLPELDEKHGLLLIQFISKLKGRCDSSIGLLKKGYIEESDIEILQENIYTIKSALSVQDLYALTDKNEIEDFLQPIFEEYKTHFENSKKSVLSIINDDSTNDIADIESNFDEFELLMKVPDIEYLIAASYQEALNSIINKISFFKREAKEIIKSFSNSPESIDFKLLYDCFSWLESGKWIEKFSEGTYSNEILGIEKEIKRCIEKLQFELKEIDLGINFHFNVPKGYSIVQKLDPIFQLEEFIPSLKNYDKNIWIEFKERVENTLKSIKREYNPELQDIAEERNEFKKLETVRKEYLKYQKLEKNLECQELLGRYGFTNIEELNTKISKIQNFIEIFKEKIAKNMPDIEKLESSFNYIEECKNIPELAESVRQFCSSVLSNLSQFYNNHLVSLENCLSSISKIILDEKNDISLIKNYSHQISLNFKEISLLNTKSPSFFRVLDMQPHCEHYIKEFNNLNYFFNEKLRICVERNQFRQIALLLTIVNDFAKINENFSATSDYYEKIKNSKLDQACQNIIESIVSHNFDRAKQLIAALDDATWNAFQDTIKEKLICSIENLIKGSYDSIFQINNSKLDYAQINEICSNFEKVSNAKQNDLYKIFDKKYEQSLIGLEKDAKTVFSEKVEAFLSAIKVAIQSIKFSEAEAKIKNIDDLKTNLLKCLGSQFESKSINDFKKNLDRLRQDIILRFEKCEINDFKELSPKLILKEFEKTSKDFPIYKESSNEIKNLIYKKFDSIRNAINWKSLQEKRSICNDILSILDFLPNDIANLAKTLSDDIKKGYDQEKKYNRERINILAKDGHIKELCDIHLKYTSEYSYKDYNYVEKKLREVVSTIRVEIISALNNHDWDSAFQKAKKLVFKDKLIRIASNCDSLFKEIESNINQAIRSNLKTLLNIEHKDSSTELIEAFNFFKIFIDFKINFDQEVPSTDMFKFENNIETMLICISDFYIKLNKSYIDFKPPHNLHNCNRALNKIKEWDELFRIFKEYLSQNGNYHMHTNYSKIENLLRYSEIANHFSEMLRQENEYFTNFKIQYDEIKHQKLLEDKAQDIQERWNRIKSYEEIKNHINPDIANLEQIESNAIESIEREMESIVESASSYINKEEINNEDFNEIRIYYSCLSAFEKNLNIKDLDWKNTIKKIEKKIYQKTNEFRQKAENEIEISKIVEHMIDMKKVSNNFPLLKKELDKVMDEFLEKFRIKNKDKAVNIVNELESHKTGLGIYIIAEHKFFEGVSQRFWLGKTQGHDIEYALEKIEGSNLNKQELNDKYEEYYEIFHDFHGTYFKIDIIRDKGLDYIISQIISDIEAFSRDHAIDPLNPDIQTIREFIPELLAYISILWMFLNMKKCNYDVDEEGETTFFKPHAIQILSIFRMIGIGYENVEPKNNLVQILTGEGKSITLAFLCSMLALLGFSVNCACYSEHLSNRDFEDFQPLYAALNIHPYIKYGTFNKLCEDDINSRGDIRAIVLDLIQNGRCPSLSDGVAERPKILLIDEVDVFFTKSFYGNMYRPLAKLRHSTIKELTDFIWKNRNGQLMELWNANEYKNCCKQFPGFEFLIEEAVKDMISKVKDLQSHDSVDSQKEKRKSYDYEVQNGKIGYKENDGISFNIVYGCDTLFAYYLENEKGKIPTESLNENIFIGINCGMFSFAEIPHKFKYIMGVTGTLKTLGDYEKIIIQNEYKIALNTYMPSVFGENNRKFRKNKDVHIENIDDYHKRIFTEINNQIEGIKEGCKRAVLVFFENEKKLMDFFNKSQLKNSNYEIQLMTESLSVENRNMMIKKATVPNTVSLLTRAYGRGIDFKCYNLEISTNGGVHVIQTFLSEDVSEETQIMGRCARQGQQGSFSMILLDNELEHFLISKLDIENMRNNGSFYESLNKKRDEFIQIENIGESNNVKQSKAQHDSTIEFLNFIQNNNIGKAKAFLKEKNKVIPIEIDDKKTIVLMDATGSMSLLLQSAKNTVSIMFSRVCEVLTRSGVNPGSFQLQYCVYRNYNAPKEKLLEVSPFTNKPDILQGFMENVWPEYGWTNEAIEVGLWHVNRVSEVHKISQVILIGDSPPNTREEISWKRGHNSDYWNRSGYNVVGYYEDELAKIIEKKIPIHAFYVYSAAQAKFQEIANLTRGQSGYLDINSISGADRLTDLVSTEVLRKTAGEKAVRLYNEMYPPTYT